MKNVNVYALVDSRGENSLKTDSFYNKRFFLGCREFRIQIWIGSIALQDPRHVRREIFRKGDPRFHHRKSPETIRKSPFNDPKSPRRLLGLASHDHDEVEFLNQRNGSNPVLSKKFSASRNLLWESPLDFVGDLFNKVRQWHWVVLGCNAMVFSF